jgi:hypothetical protein
MKSIESYRNNFPKVIVDFSLYLEEFYERLDAGKALMNYFFPAIPSLFCQFPEGVSNFNKVTVESV